MANLEHSAISDPFLHEPKGASTATSGQFYVSDGAGSGNWYKAYLTGFEDYNDAASGSQALTSGSWVKLQNDGAGVFTRTTYKLPGTGPLWDVVNDQFDWTSFQLGDAIIIRADVTFTVNTNGDEVALRLRLAEGTGSEIPLEFFRKAFKTAGTYRIVAMAHLYLGTSLVKDNPAIIQAFSDSSGDSCVVNGWYTRIDPYNPVFA